MSKLNLNQSLIDKARSSARNIAEEVQRFVDEHTTVAVERTILRLYGVDGTDEIGTPLPNIIIDNLKKAGGLSAGIAYFMANAVLNTHLNPQEIGEKIAAGELDITKLPLKPEAEIKAKAEEMARSSVERVKKNRARRDEYLSTLGEGPRPYLYVIVATGNIYEDIIQAQAAARQGADIIAVIRTTGQSLLDYVPYGATTEGFGGTYATQENFRIMRKALDEVGEEVGRYIRLCNYCSGLCMPEIAAMGALERLDVMLNDALYGILFRDINMQRTFVDQFFSRTINGFAGVIINTGEDNYLTTADAVEEAHTVLASQFMNEQLALKAGLPEEQMGLGHAFEMDPNIENGFLMELAQAQMAREIFPKAPLKYMPPTKFMTGNIFKGHLQDALFNMISIWTHQGLQLLGMMTEAIHTPFMSDRALSIENARYIFNNMRNIGDEVEFKEGGMIQTRAAETLQKAADMLAQIEEEGLFATIEQGKFGGVKRSRTGGKGLDGVVMKDEKYINPFIPLMLNIELTRSKSPASEESGCQSAGKSSMDSTNIQRESKLPLNEVSFNK
ncbi:lysine 5,6-aminomutase subunit alpha [Lutispora saccharofermentans]|uniref:Lysine 5,6-aminomutase subunit alpha n=1 Tax=Lutispora saccharofermentans TaxID=3024236 RepID=A0ABT1NEQ4_9FIRM|nr:lysine 5,6-aminomutase subunit alpha [Lutispora saccharofermentans]MCQ1529099.1 lysine 5,6-aminomutase subunit alpha [Lutispora saccharofermentans]